MARKNTPRVVDCKLLQSWDGVKDVVVHKASVESRDQNDLSKDGKASTGPTVDETGYADLEARKARYGFTF